MPPSGYQWSNGVLVQRSVDDLETRGNPEAPQKCKYCEHAATASIIHAEGKAYVPVCDPHTDKGVDAIGGPDEVDKVVPIIPLTELRKELGPGPQGARRARLDADQDHQGNRHSPGRGAGRQVRASDWSG